MESGHAMQQVEPNKNNEVSSPTLTSVPTSIPLVTIIEPTQGPPTIDKYHFLPCLSVISIFTLSFLKAGVDGCL